MTASTLPRDLQWQLFRLLAFSSWFEQALGEALTEARLPGSMGDPETVRILERAQAEEAALSNYILRRLYPGRGL